LKKSVFIFVLWLMAGLCACQLKTGGQTEEKPVDRILKKTSEPRQMKDTEPARFEDFAKKAAADEFNFPEKSSEPQEGGRVRVRTTADPRLINLILSNDASANQVLGYVYDSLLTRDPETFEWLPWIAHTWEIRDIAFIGGKPVEGFYDEKTGVFYPGQGMVSALEKEIKPMGGNRFEIRGRTYAGKLEKMNYTARILPLTGPSVSKILPQNLKRQSVFIFHLRDGVAWHDGRPLSVEDVLFSFQIITNEHTDAGHLRNYYRDIEEVKKLDSHTLRFTYKKSYFLALSFCGGIPIIPRHRYYPERFKGDAKSLGSFFNSHPDNWKPVGNGPYIFREWKRGQWIKLSKNPNYWARKAGFPYFKSQQPYLDEIQFVVINNSNAALKELMSGNIDADFEITQELWHDQRTLSESFVEKFARARFLTPLYTYVGWNLERPYFKDYRVRQALSHLIPKKKILDEIHRGLGQEVTGPFFINGPVYDHSIDPLPYDPAKARELLRQAGWVDHDGDGIRDKDGIAFRFEYLIHNAKEYHQKIADIIKESLEQAGIIMNIRVIDWSIFSQTVTDRNFDAVRFAWGTGIDGDEFQIWHSSQSGKGGSNFISFADAEVDQILEECRNLFDPLERWKRYRRMHHILHRLQPYSFLFSFDTLAYYHRKFRGVKLYTRGPNLNEWYIEEKK
jgi:peptide/nickel transport system substrate-binding protein